ncbi:MAG: glycosyltransferase [Bacteroidetes bacterium]|nr:glycosyltransferase [Bacteroidota bacterium]
MNNTPLIYIALPAMDEALYLPKCLDCIENQNYKNFHIVICINQPNEWWELSEKRNICENNAVVLEYLNKKDKTKYTIIDKSSKGNGWENNKHGVGWARKTAMDFIAKKAENTDIILSLDADTSFSPDYFSSVINSFSKFPDAVALSNPYYHKLSGSEAEDRAILRYEIYMRNYAINLLRIASPYAYTALGSAIALTVSSYKAIGGLTPKKSGEDFYFLQKLRKYGSIIVFNNEKVFPAARFSDRVFFGTGPAMIKGNNGDWSSYPVYHHSLFDNIKKTYNCFPMLYKKDCDTPLDQFLFEQYIPIRNRFAEDPITDKSGQVGITRSNHLCYRKPVKNEYKTNEIWKPLRENHKDVNHFVRACHEKLDGLRILQYLKSEQQLINKTFESCLYDNILEVFGKTHTFEKLNVLKKFHFNECSLDLLNEIRNYLTNLEEIMQKSIKII